MLTIITSRKHSPVGTGGENLRFEIKTSRGYLVIEDVSKDQVAIWFAEGETPAVAIEKKRLKPLGTVDPRELRRLGKGV